MIMDMDSHEARTIIKITFIILIISNILFFVDSYVFGEKETELRIKRIEKERDYYRKQMLNFCELSKNYDNLITGDYKNKRLMDKPCDYYLVNNTNKS